jgi:hypothetical protein
MLSEITRHRRTILSFSYLFAEVIKDKLTEIQSKGFAVTSSHVESWSKDTKFQLRRRNKLKISTIQHSDYS